MRLLGKRRLSRAALSLSSRARLSVVNRRTRCLRVVLSMVIRAMASRVHSDSRSRTWPRSSPMRIRPGENLGLAGLDSVLGVQH
jgi:hypothetical protein